jgi:hypothetical protein
MDIWDENNQPPSKSLRVAWAAGYAGFIAINAASQLGLLGTTNAEVSAKFTVPLTPEG